MARRFTKVLIFFSVFVSGKPLFAKEEGFSFISLLPFRHSLEGLEHPTNSLVDFSNISLEPAIYSTLVVFILILLAIIARFRLKGLLNPKEKADLPNLFEVIVELLTGLLDNVIGHEGKRHLPLIGGLALFILFSNLLGLIPGFSPPTDNINITFGCAITVFFYYNLQGFKANGLTYLRHFTGPQLWLAPIMLPIEILGHLARPLSLSLRLFGNITGDHLVLVIFSGLIPLVVPLFAFGLGIFVSFLQAIIFILLSMMYISRAIEHD